MCQFCRPLENLLQRDRHPALLRPFLPLLSKVHGKAKPLLGRCYRKPLAAAIKFHRAWEASGLFPDKLRKFEEEIENLQREVENHEEILVDLQGYGSGIGRWGSVGRGRSKASSRASKMENRPSRNNGRTRRGNRRERDPYVDDGDEKAADGQDGSSSSRSSVAGEEEGEEEEEEEEEEEKGTGQVRGRNTPAQDAANFLRPRLSIPRHRDSSAARPRSAMRRAQPAGVVRQQPEASPLITPLSPGPESPKTTKKEKPRFRFRKGVKAYINDLFEYKVNELVDHKVEKRLALERSREPGRAPASGVSNKNVTFPEGTKEGDFSHPEPKRPALQKGNNKLSVPKVGQPKRPRSSTVPRSSPYRARSGTPAPALYRVESSRRETGTTRAKSQVPELVDDEPEVGKLDAEERGGQQKEWVYNVEEEEKYKNEDAEEVVEASSDAASMVANDGFTDADDGVYQDIRSMARLREIHPEPAAAASGPLHAAVEEDVTSDDASVDPVRLVRDLWPNLGPRRPLKRRNGFVNVRAV